MVSLFNIFEIRTEKLLKHMNTQNTSSELSELRCHYTPFLRKILYPHDRTRGENNIIHVMFISKAS